jgi:ATP-dependent protease ClpP protease subunit
LRLAQAAHRPISVIAEDCARGRFLIADEAVRYGLVDEIATPRGVVYPYHPRSFGFSDSR